MAAQIDDDKALFGIISSQELATELAANITLMDLLIPIGEIVPILVGLAGVPTPDPNVFQECNGSEITNPNSPLRTIGGSQKFTPNMLNRYLKVPTVFGQSGEVGGVNIATVFDHDHLGVTGTFTSPEGVDQDNDLQESAFVHAHLISSSLGSVAVDPPFVGVKFYMRIQ